jgi:hypothetical protein
MRNLWWEEHKGQNFYKKRGEMCKIPLGTHTFNPQLMLSGPWTKKAQKMVFLSRDKQVTFMSEKLLFCRHQSPF